MTLTDETLRYLMNEMDPTESILYKEKLKKESKLKNTCQEYQDILSKMNSIPLKSPPSTTKKKILYMSRYIHQLNSRSIFYKREVMLVAASILMAFVIIFLFQMPAIKDGNFDIETAETSIKPNFLNTTSSKSVNNFTIEKNTPWLVTSKDNKQFGNDLIPINLLSPSIYKADETSSYWVDKGKQLKLEGIKTNFLLDPNKMFQVPYLENRSNEGLKLVNSPYQSYLRYVKHGKNNKVLLYKY